MPLSELGFRVIEEANNLKRTKEAIAKELNVSKNQLEKIIRGKCTIVEEQKFIEKMLKKYPIDVSKFKNLKIEKFRKFSIFDRKSSMKSSRVFKRKNLLGITKDYYEYRDTAMSKSSPIYPEWIQPLTVVDNNNPRNKKICYNKGHILHQFTFFIGEVNFYWKDKKGYHCKSMNTGDSNYIPPFIPHSFSSRNKKKLGLIIAVTFADILRFSRIKFSQYSRQDIEKFSGSPKSKLSFFRFFIRDFLNKKFLDVDFLLQKMQKSGLNEKTSIKIINGKKIPNTSELNILANILSVPFNYLNNIIQNCPSGVFNKKLNSKDYRRISTKNSFFRIWDLAHTNYENFLNTFIMEVNSHTKKFEIFHQMHEYVYNFSEQDITLEVSGKKYNIKPEESIIFSPMVKHFFYTKNNIQNAKIVIIRVSEEFSQDFTYMFAGLEQSSRKKIFSDVSQWF